MIKPYSRTVRRDLMIMMSKPFTNPTADVELLLPTGAVVSVAAATLNREHARQQAAYAAEAYVDAGGVRRGPSGARRRTNRIRLVDVAHLVVQLGDCSRSAA
jgi:hypothetical protein